MRFWPCLGVWSLCGRSVVVGLNVVRLSVSCAASGRPPARVGVPHESALWQHISRFGNPESEDQVLLPDPWDRPFGGDRRAASDDRRPGAL